MSQWQQGICNEKSGFLFSHPCDRAPFVSCHVCTKPICSDHAHATDGQTLCTSCKKKEKGISRRSNRRDVRNDDFDDDPYFYGPMYGGHYGYYGNAGSYGNSGSYLSSGTHHHDAHDFTEADGESFAQAGDSEFENDMTES